MSKSETPNSQSSPVSEGGQSDGWRPTHQHVKSGSFYQTLNVALDATNARDGQRVVIYRNAQGQWFVREQSEFHDGRFVHVCKLTPSPDKEDRT